MTRFFVAKAWLGASALTIGLVGMATVQHWLVWIAVVLAAAAFLLRFLERRPPEPL